MFTKKRPHACKPLTVSLKNNLLLANLLLNKNIGGVFTKKINPIEHIFAATKTA